MRFGQHNHSSVFELLSLKWNRLLLFIVLSQGKRFKGALILKAIYFRNIKNANFHASYHINNRFVSFLLENLCFQEESTETGCFHCYDNHLKFIIN